MHIGFIVNPIAGMGGRVGLKGTDNVLDEAITKGAEPVAPKRAKEFLKRLEENMGQTKIEMTTCPGIMGEEEAKDVDCSFTLLPMKLEKKTTARETQIAAKLLVKKKVDLIVFVGGDGTAKDIFDAMKNSEKMPVLGVPSGVKMYSGIFAVNPTDAAEVVLAFARGEADTAEFEIMDADESAIRSDSFNVKLHGLLEAPFLPAHIQGSKQVSPDTVDEKDNQMAIAKFVVEEMPAGATWIFGPGTTVKCIAELLGVEKTVLGVDIYRDGKVFLDVNEKQILEKIQDWDNTWIVLSPIGRQGILLGRGNQQISPGIIKRVGRERILVVATRNKLQSIEGNVLRVDTGDMETDELLRGYGRVVTDYREWRLVQIQ
jgi:predicted polyphosphate/ATP-dependent NAD kinase